MIEITEKDWFEKGKRLYGEDIETWEFKCWFCGRVQSMKSIREDQAKGILSQRFGKLKKGDSFTPEQCCYAPDCDYVSNGLFTTGVLVIVDPELPHNEALKKNCLYVLAFAKEG